MAEKLKMHSPDLVMSNIEKIADLFPNCVTEATGENGKIERKIDLDLLRQELSGEIVEGPLERYHLNWPGKREAMLAANAPIAKTLRPSREESVDFDTTKNLFIEGDNLEALKLLQETYLGKVKMIYIDRPYNTGNDFVYSDDFSDNADTYLEKSLQNDSGNQKLVINSESGGRFHSNWLSMIYPRIKQARALLRDDGVMFISIDEKESANLRKLCDEVFGASNFVAQIVWQRKYGASNNAKGVAPLVDFILCYGRSDKFTPGLFPRSQTATERYANPDNDPRGPWKPVDFWNPLSPQERPNLAYEITNPHTQQIIKPEKKAWKNSRDKYLELEADGRIYWGKSGTNSVPTLKRFLSEVRDGVVPTNFWDWKFAGHTDAAKKEIEQVIEPGVFDTPKPTLLIKRMCELAQCADGDLVMDFFAGSGTTADAVLSLNVEVGSSLRFIVVQVDEACDESSVPFAKGYKHIAQIARERIRRAGAAIREANIVFDSQLDVGFRVLTIDSSNMKDVYYNPSETSQSMLEGLIDNIKPDRTAEDLLFQVLLDCGVDLGLPIKSEKVEGCEVFFVNDSEHAPPDLVACFDQDVPKFLIKTIAAKSPLRAVFRDQCFANDAVKINVEQIFRQLSPNTQLKSL